MANAAKRKGDDNEREAVRFLTGAVPDLVSVANPMRMLGAGRKEDVGDLHLFGDVAIQVRAYQLKNIGLALRSAAVDATRQASHRMCRHGLGLVPYPRARARSVKWVAATETWPAPWLLENDREPVLFKMVTRCLDWVRDDEGPYGYLARPRHTRTALLATGNSPPIIVAPVEAWLHAYRRAVWPENGSEPAA